MLNERTTQSKCWEPVPVGNFEKSETSTQQLLRKKKQALVDTSTCLKSFQYKVESQGLSLKQQF